MINNLENLISVMGQNFDVRDNITPETALIDAAEHDLDSLDMVEMHIAIEQEYSVRNITDEEAEATKTVGDMLALIATKQASVEGDSDAKS